jgi:hypothetical protein
MDMRTMNSTLWQRIAGAGLGSVAVVGMSKNTGKTVTLNHLLAQAATARVSMGLSSIGRDGEERDQVFQIPKPAIVVWPGTLVATARGTLQRAKLRFTLVANTQVASPMGEILIVKALDPGEMEVAGASRGSDQRRVMQQLQQCGASLVLLDGALGRSHHASPAIAQSVILATGAALGGGMADVVRKTRDRLAILGIKQADASLCALCQPVLMQGGVGLWNAAGEPLFQANIATLNAAGVLLKHIESPIATIALSGAVGRSLWQALMTLAARHSGLRVLVADGSKLFVDHADLLAFERLGAQLLAFQAINILGLTLNPFSPFGGSFAAAEFLHTARLAFTDYQVNDVMLETQLETPGQNANAVHDSSKEIT